MGTFKSIRGKMLFGFSTVVILIVLLGVYIVYTLNHSNNLTKAVLDKELPLLIIDEQLSLDMANQLAASRGFILTGDDSFKELFNSYTEKSENRQSSLKKLGGTQESINLFERTVEWRNFVTEQVFAEYERGNEEEALRNVMSMTDEARSLMSSYEEAAKNRENFIIDLEKNMLANGKTTLLIVTGVIVLVILLSIATAIITANSISRPLRIVMNRMKLITSGDLSSEPMETHLKDEIGQLIASTNEMSASTRHLLDEINHVAETVSTQSEELTQSANEVKAGTAQIAITMEDLANGTESQADNATILSSSMETFVAKVMEANENGMHVQKSSTSVLEMTNQGSELMNSSSKQMAVIDQIVHDAVVKVEGLDQHTQEISELVSVIQDIAGQTNLLALNAAIEAARAGEHGKGFAVVADEVRKLAEQSSSSVTNITDIVNRIQNESRTVTDSLQHGYKEVEEGTSQIKQTGETFDKISTAVTEMANRIHSIAEDLNDISANGQEMRSSIEEIAAITEQSAAGVEETSASSEQASSAMEEVANNSNDLAKLAEELNLLMQRFKL
ncbi:methyl-accepting chemotaxis protein [Sporosarcina newyorkensis 2681]|uniref:Methyl-accepting chemotaxis protein n=1 Tax=Sporosarcina newyorkensis 2681 TaxID=1027292 RepID=F9DTI8_9BACL|nr:MULTISPECIES: methyl-accepting chemotaxis protein [Sporosarcina]EGQ25746.1 methyl-accepting chemotaxis protein [Sporosarcina newyorkensis 2681]MBY0224048.1 methyl-accepting chemotaxis protein [Sporosarcina aquimarina]